MAYIGRQNLGGAYRQLDDISSGFDGSDTTHTMQVNSANVTVGDVNQIILSLGGVIQNPGTDFTVSGSVLTFTTAPAANTSFFAILLGSDNGGTTTPTDASVTTGKIVDDAVTAAKVASSGAFAIGAAGTTSSIAGANILVEANSLFIGDDVSGTTDTAANSVAVGIDALDAVTTGDANVAIGKSALSAVNTGGNNIAIGNQAGAALTDGTDNIAMGSNALDDAASSARNIAIGSSALTALNESGNTYNIGIGYDAGKSITTGLYNTLIGHLCGDGFDTESNNVGVGLSVLGGPIAGGEYNVAVGNGALELLTSGDGNNAVGYQALTACTTGGYNQAVGDRALTAVVDGQKNTAIGQQAGFAITSGSNNIMIGYDSGRSSSPAGNVTTASNQICLGDDNITAIFCADTSISASDKRDKTDIKNFTTGLSFIEKMQPVTYKWDKRSWYSDDLLVTPDGSKKATETNVGFLAQDVETLEKEIGFANDKNDMLFVNLTEDDKRYGMKYERLVTVLVNAVKELSAKVKALEEA